MVPRMIVVAGPPGGGKSSVFPVASFGVACFNADDRAAELNRGSYVGISKEVRRTVNREFEAFVSDCIGRRISSQSRQPSGGSTHQAFQICRELLPKWMTF